MHTILKYLLIASLLTIAECVEIDAPRCDCACEREAILLSDIRELELNKGELTASGRLPPIPRLECIGGSAKGYKEPRSIRCVNVGRSVLPHWRCEAALDSEVKLGQVTVTCEGFSAPHDPYVLRGSCGLKYTLEYTKWSWYILGYCSRLINLLVLTPLKWITYLVIIAVVSLAGLSLIRPSNKKRASRVRVTEYEEDEQNENEGNEEYEEFSESEEEEGDEEEVEEDMINEEINWKERLRPRSGIASPGVAQT